MVPSCLEFNCPPGTLILSMKYFPVRDSWMTPYETSSPNLTGYSHLNILFNSKTVRSPKRRRWKDKIYKSTASNTVS
jgi:hypothetical protein